MKVTVTVDDCETTATAVSAPQPGRPDPEQPDIPTVEQVSLLIPTPGKSPKVVPLPEPLAGFLRQFYD